MPMAKILGQPMVVDNKPGASGTLGPATMAATAKPDGYTLSQMPISVVRIPIMQKTSFDTLKDFTYIAQLTGYTFGITTKADSAFKTWADVVKFAKDNPGKVTYGTPGTGTSLHIGMEMIAAKEGIKLTQVPFKGAAETNAAVLGGHTMLQADSSGWKPLVDGGQLKLLAIWTAERSAVWKDAPTLKELGYPFVFDSPFGVAGPKGMDPAIVKTLADAFKKAMAEPAVIEALKKYDMFPRYLDTADYQKAMAISCVTKARRWPILVWRRKSEGARDDQALPRQSRGSMIKEAGAVVAASATPPWQLRAIGRRIPVQADHVHHAMAGGIGHRRISSGDV